MRKAILVSIAVIALASGVRAQDSQICKMPVNLERLAAKASEVVDVNIDSNMLKFAGNFLNKDNSEEAQAQKIVSNLKGLCVRSFQFDENQKYAEEDIEGLRSQFRAPVWSRMVGVRSKRDKENVDVYFRMENGAVAGLAVIAVEPNELTVVHIDGAIDPSQLSELGGQFGIPKVAVPPKAKPAGKVESK
jgi:hypothetical protein